MTHALLIIASVIVMIVGLAGTILPMLPGIPLIYLGMIIYGVGSGWQVYSVNFMLFWGVVTILMVLLE